MTVRAPLSGQTHPWNDFKLHWKELLDHDLMKIGEISSKISHMLGVPLSPELSERLHLVWLERGAVATAAIEGNTLTVEQAHRLRVGASDLPHSMRYQEREVKNMLEAFGRVAPLAIRDGADGKTLTTDLLCEFNRLCMEGVPIEDDHPCGVIRSHSVEVNRYRGAPASECRVLLDRLCEWLDQEWRPDLPDWCRYDYGIAAVKAAYAHLYMAWIHPFADGNGRTARLLEFYLLLRAEFPTSAAHLMSNHYHRTRGEYRDHLSRASRNWGHSTEELRLSVVPFISYALQGLVDGIQMQINELLIEQTKVAWKDHVYSVFDRLKPSKTNKRRRKIAISLGLKTLDVAEPGHPFEGEHRLLIPRLDQEIAEALEGLTSRTISRDLNELVKMELVTRVGGGKYVGNVNLLLERFSAANIRPPAT